MCGSLPVISLMDVSTADLCGRSRISSPDLDPCYRYLFRGKVFFDVEMMKVRFPDLPITRDHPISISVISENQW
jgi:hypothetical protein